MSNEISERWEVLSKQFEHPYDVHSTSLKDLASLPEILLPDHPWFHPETIDPEFEYRLHVVEQVSGSAMDHVLFYLHDIGELMWKRADSEGSDPADDREFHSMGIFIQALAGMANALNGVKDRAHHAIEQRIEWEKENNVQLKVVKGGAK